MQIFHREAGVMGANCYFIAQDNGDCIVVDPGGTPERLIRLMEEESLTPRAILLTHGHFDHIGACAVLRERYHIPISIHRADAQMIEDGKNRLMHAYRVTPFSADQLLEDGDIIHIGEISVQTIHTPGHTPGSVTYRVEGVLLSGDTLFYHNVGRTDLEGGDYAALLESLGRLAALEGDYRVLPGHDRPTTLEEERKFNRYMKEALAK